jgi:hypothetical protein
LRRAINFDGVAQMHQFSAALAGSEARALRLGEFVRALSKRTVNRLVPRAKFVHLRLCNTTDHISLPSARRPFHAELAR